jgi:hypothetical protein
LIAMLKDTPLGRVIPVIVADRVRVPELAQAHREIVEEKRARHRAVVSRGIARGDLRADVDVDAVVDAYVGPVFYRFLVSDAPLDDAYADSLVDTVLRAFS